MKNAQKILVIFLALGLILGSYFYAIGLIERVGGTYTGISESFTAYVTMVVAMPEDRDLDAEIAAIDDWYSVFLNTLEQNSALNIKSSDSERVKATYALWFEIAPKLKMRKSLPEEAVLKLMDITKAMLSELPEARFNELREILEVNP